MHESASWNTSTRLLHGWALPPKRLTPKGFTIRIRDIILNCGSEMIVAIAGDMLRMPGLPKNPQTEHITIVNGEIEGLS